MFDGYRPYKNVSQLNKKLADFSELEYVNEEDSAKGSGTESPDQMEDSLRTPQKLLDYGNES